MTSPAAEPSKLPYAPHLHHRCCCDRGIHRGAARSVCAFCWRRAHGTTPAAQSVRHSTEHRSCPAPARLQCILSSTSSSTLGQDHCAAAAACDVRRKWRCRRTAARVRLGAPTDCSSSSATLLCRPDGHVPSPVSSPPRSSARRSLCLCLSTCCCCCQLSQPLHHVLVCDTTISIAAPPARVRAVSSLRLTVTLPCRLCLILVPTSSSISSSEIRASVSEQLAVSASQRQPQQY